MTDYLSDAYMRVLAWPEHDGANVDASLPLIQALLADLVAAGMVGRMRVR